MAAPLPAPRILTLRRVVVTALVVAVVLAGALVGVFLAFESDLPQVTSLEDFQPNIITQVFAADGSVIGEFAIEKRVVVAFRDIPPVLRNAIVAVEDADFWKHLGINFWRIPGAALANLRSGRRGQGFSTLTMQLTRLLFLTPEKTYERKIKEVILAFQIEKNFTKEEILTLYCNQIYFGHGNYGVEAASRFFFSTPVRDLALHEAALIAGVAQSPGRLSPIENPERALARRNHVLDRMAEEKYVTLDEAEAAKREPLGLRLRRDPLSTAPHFLEEVRKYLEREYGSQRIYQGGLRVYTTLDPALQRAAVKSLRDGLRVLDRRARGFVPPVATVLLDGQLPTSPCTSTTGTGPSRQGDVVRGVVIAFDRPRRRAGRRLPRAARAGGRRLDGAQPGRGPAARRDRPLPHRVAVRDGRARGSEGSPGAGAEGRGRAARPGRATRARCARWSAATTSSTASSTARHRRCARWARRSSRSSTRRRSRRCTGRRSTVLVDAPLSFPNPWNKTTWSPHNYDGAYLGPITLRRAVEQSRNIPAVKTLQAVGVEKGIEYARRLGLTGELPPYLPIALGAGEATLQEMVSAYATFANQGLRMKPFLIERITDRDGNEVEQAAPKASDALRADTAFIVTSLLRGVVERGTAARAHKLGRPIAGKTGTTNDFTDAWFIGFEPSLAGGRVGRLRREEGHARARRERRRRRRCRSGWISGPRRWPTGPSRSSRSPATWCSCRSTSPGRPGAPARRACTWRRSWPGPSRARSRP